MVEKQILENQILEKQNKFPNGLISPKYDLKKCWFLIRFYLKSKPRWIGHNQTSGFYLCFFREIGYLDENNTLIGLGRSWLPISLLSLKIILKCTFSKSPLGVVIKELFDEQLNFVVVANDLKLKCLTPYRNHIEKTSTYHRIINFKGKTLAIIEEDFIYHSEINDEL